MVFDKSQVWVNMMKNGLVDKNKGLKIISQKVNLDGSKLWGIFKTLLHFYILLYLFLYFFFILII